MLRGKLSRRRLVGVGAALVVAVALVVVVWRSGDPRVVDEDGAAVDLPDGVLERWDQALESAELPKGRVTVVWSGTSSADQEVHVLSSRDARGTVHRPAGTDRSWSASLAPVGSRFDDEVAVPVGSGFVLPPGGTASELPVRCVGSRAPVRSVPVTGRFVGAGEVTGCVTMTWRYSQPALQWFRGPDEPVVITTAPGETRTDSADGVEQWWETLGGRDGDAVATAVRAGASSFEDVDDARPVELVAEITDLADRPDDQAGRMAGAVLRRVLPLPRFTSMSVSVGFSRTDDRATVLAETRAEDVRARTVAARWVLLGAEPDPTERSPFLVHVVSAGMSEATLRVGTRDVEVGVGVGAVALPDGADPRRPPPFSITGVDVDDLPATPLAPR